MTSSEQDHLDRVWDILERHSVGMLTTRFAGGLRARPLDARPDRDGGVIDFLTDSRGLKDDEISAAPDVCFTVIDDGERAYLSITGQARVFRDDLRAATIWKAADDVWWPDGPRDRHLRILRIEPELAELWDGPKSDAVAKYEFARARITHEKPNLGENRKISVRL